MEWVETTGKTVEEAKDAALDQLGVDEADAEFDVVEEPKLGLFGRVRNEARVRARVRPSTPRSKDDRRDRRKRGGGGRSNGGRSESAASNGRNGGQRQESGRGRGGGQSRSSSTKPHEDRAPKASNRTARTESDGGKMDDVVVPLKEQSAIAEEFLRGLLEEFGASSEVTTVEVDEDTVEVQVSGGDLGILIGPKGATLSALQEVTRTVVQRKTGARNGRLLLDVSGYRAKRREALARFTHDVAGRVIESGQATALDPMSPADRKVVHDTANGIEGVTTSSQGEEPRRRVVISPA